MIFIRNNSIRKPVVFILTLAILVTSMGFGVTQNAFAEGDASPASVPQPVSVSVRIEDADSTILSPTALSVDRFNLAPFLSACSGSFPEPNQIVAAHALIEAIYYQNYGEDPTLDILTSGALTAEVINTIKADLDLIYNNSLYLGSIFNNSYLLMSSIDDVGSKGIGNDVLSNGNQLVFYPYRTADVNTLNYSYFSETSVQATAGTPVTVLLKNIVTDPKTWVSSVEPANDARIYISGIDSGITTSALGAATLTFPESGEYIITASKGNPNTISRPYCKVTVTGGIGLSSLKIDALNEWGSYDPINVAPFMDSQNSYTLTVPNAQSTFSAVAISSGEDITMSAVYTKAGDVSSSAVDIISGSSVVFDLEAGNNLLDLTVGKGSDTKTYHLTVSRQPAISALDVSFIGSENAPRSLLSSATTKVNFANSSVTGISVTAIQKTSNQSISVKYKKSGSDFGSQIPLESGTSVSLPNSIGLGNNNTFEFTITERGASKTYILIVSQIGSEAVSATVDTIIDSISHNITELNSDYIMAMYAAGKSSLISETEKNKFLSSVLIKARSDYFDINTVSKMIIALTAMGIDPRQVPDANGTPIDLVSKLSNATTTGGLGLYGIYTAPYILLAYDSGDYEVSTSAGLSRGNVIQYTLDNLDKPALSSWAWGDVDATALVLPALAPYRVTSSALTNEATVAAVHAAIDNAVNWLSAQQKPDGSFYAAYASSSNSNTTATVVLALSALGIDADNDPRFIKGNISALKDLLSYRTPDNSFGLTDTSYNAFATKQGYQALVAYRSLINNSPNGGNLYQFSSQVSRYDKWPSSRILTDILVTSYPAVQVIGKKITPNDLVVKAKYKTESTQELITLSGSDYTISDYNYNKAGAQTVEISYQGKTTSFVVTVTDPSAPSQETKKISIAVRGAKGKILVRDSNFVIVENKTTVLEALRGVLATAGYTAEVEGGYVVSIDGVGEFDLGRNSGWMYSVNDKTPPTTAASTFTLKNGDVVLWYFTEDFTKDPSSSKWTNAAAAGSSEMLEAVVDSGGKATVTITKDTLNTMLNGTKDSLMVNSPIAALTIDKSVIKSILDQATKEIKFEIAKADTSKLSEEAKALIGNRPVYDFTITSGSKTISNLNGKVTITIPYAPVSNENPDSLIIYYIDDTGRLQMIKDCKYDSKTKSVVFHTNHFSRYAIGYRSVAFSDTKGHWSEQNINYLAARSILNGKSEGKFMPNDNITRAEFITILANKSGVDLKNASAAAVTTFRDVKPADWFSAAVAWGAKNNIISGADGTFRPNDRITRQEMAVILDRYMTNIDRNTAAGSGKTVNFSDATKIASYAKSSVERMQKLGIINGKTAYTFAPTDFATRAESAKMIAILLQSTI